MVVYGQSQLELVHLEHHLRTHEIAIAYCCFQWRGLVLVGFFVLAPNFFEMTTDTLVLRLVREKSTCSSRGNFNAVHLNVDEPRTAVETPAPCPRKHHPPKSPLCLDIARSASPAYDDFNSFIKTESAKRSAHAVVESEWPLILG